MCGLAWQIYLTAAGAGGAAAATGKQCELKFIWGLTIRKQHRDDKLFGHQAQNLHAQKGRKPEEWVTERERERVSDTCQWVVEKLIIFTKVNCTHTHTHTVAHTHTHTHAPPCLCTWVNKQQQQHHPNCIAYFPARLSLCAFSIYIVVCVCICVCVCVSNTTNKTLTNYDKLLWLPLMLAKT